MTHYESDYLDYQIRAGELRKEFRALAESALMTQWYIQSYPAIVRYAKMYNPFIGWKLQKIYADFLYCNQRMDEIRIQQRALE